MLSLEPCQLSSPTRSSIACFALPSVFSLLPPPASSPSLFSPLGCLFYTYSLVYPLDTLKTQIQASSSSSEKDPNDPTAPPPSPTLLSLLLPLFKNPRLIFSLYKGFLASMLNTFSVSPSFPSAKKSLFHWVEAICFGEGSVIRGLGIIDVLSLCLELTFLRSGLYRCNTPTSSSTRSSDPST